MYILGLIVLTILNVGFYFDQIQHSKDLHKSDPLIFNFVMFFFFMVEIILFTLFYLLIEKTIGYFF